jgi:hypothetical protein
MLEVMTGILDSSVGPEPPVQGECCNHFICGRQRSNRTLFSDALAARSEGVVGAVSSGAAAQDAASYGQLRHFVRSGI